MLKERERIGSSLGLSEQKSSSEITESELKKLNLPNILEYQETAIE